MANTNVKNKKRKKSLSGMALIRRVWLILFCVSLALGTGLGVYIMKWRPDSEIATVLDQTEPGGVVNILLLGTDESGDRSDTIMLVNINGETGKVNVLSIPRDTAIGVKNSSGKITRFNKINSYLAIGKQEVAKGNIKDPEELVIRRVKEITGLPIHYFVTIDFDGFINIIDALGGVDYNVPEDMHYDDPAQDLHIHLNKGMQHLDGKKAHDFMRYRNYKSGRADLARVDAQQAFIKELVKQKLTVSNLNKIDDLYKMVNENVRTNYGFDSLMKSFGTIKNLKAEDINMYVLPNTPKMIYGASYVIYNTEENMAELEIILENFRSEEQKKQRAEKLNNQ